MQLWTRFSRATYRREPISSFMLTAGTVDAVMGGVGGYGSLLALGLGAVGISALIRWWLRRHQHQPSVSSMSHRAPIRYLPAQSSQPLPRLTNSRKRP